MIQMADVGTTATSSMPGGAMAPGMRAGMPGMPGNMNGPPMPPAGLGTTGMTGPPGNMNSPLMPGAGMNGPAGMARPGMGATGMPTSPGMATGVPPQAPVPPAAGGGDEGMGGGLGKRKNMDMGGD